jgi:hypothetical protein
MSANTIAVFMLNLYFLSIVPRYRFRQLGHRYHEASENSDKCHSWLPFLEVHKPYRLAEHLAFMDSDSSDSGASLRLLCRFFTNHAHVDLVVDISNLSGGCLDRMQRTLVRT